MTRRGFLAALGGLLVTGRSSAESYPAPDLSEGRIRELVAGIRPFREGAVRLEAESRGGRPVVHSYGYGGSGITMAPGAAQVAAELLRERLAPPARVAVLGSGIIGLSTALKLLDLGYPVSLYARDFPPHTTSDLAGGLWAPAEVGLGTTPEEQQLYQRILQLSYDFYQAQSLPDIKLAPVFLTPGVLAHLNPLPPQLRVEQLARLPFPGQRPAGMRVFSFLIRTSTYLPKLLEEVRQRAEVHTRTFCDPSELDALPEEAVVNCLGLGAGALLQDARVQPIRGQLVRVEPTGLRYALGHDGGYMISRDDVLIAGGTFEPGVSDPVPDPAACQAILERNRALFR